MKQPSISPTKEDKIWGTESLEYGNFIPRITVGSTAFNEYGHTGKVVAINGNEVEMNVWNFGLEGDFEYCDLNKCRPATADEILDAWRDPRDPSNPFEFELAEQGDIITRFRVSDARMIELQTELSKLSTPVMGIPETLKAVAKIARTVQEFSLLSFTVGLSAGSDPSNKELLDNMIKDDVFFKPVNHEHTEL